MIKFNKRRPVEASLNVAPLVDIVFLLLIFFLLTSAFIHPGLELTLPEARPAEAQEAEENVVQITKEGEIYLNAEPVSEEQLRERLQESLAADPDKVIVIKADEKLEFGLFVSVMDISREAGARNLTISTVFADDPLDPLMDESHLR